MSSLLVASHRLIVVVGPSGAGKDSVISAWLSCRPEATRPHRARRTITRPADVHEAHESLSAPAFAAAREADGLAFHRHAHGLDCGIRHGELAALALGGRPAHRRRRPARAVRGRARWLVDGARHGRRDRRLRNVNARRQGDRR